MRQGRDSHRACRSNHRLQVKQPCSQVSVLSCLDADKILISPVSKVTKRYEKFSKSRFAYFRPKRVKLHFSELQ